LQGCEQLLNIVQIHHDRTAEPAVPPLFPACLLCPGSIKRWGMKRGAMTHGSKSHREHGSTGPGTTPGRNFPGLKMAGQMGNVRRKVRSLQVLKVDLERRAIVVKGSVPGKPGNVLEIAPAKVSWRRFREHALPGQVGNSAKWRRQCGESELLTHAAQEAVYTGVTAMTAAAASQAIIVLLRRPTCCACTQQYISRSAGQHPHVSTAYS
jgi:hypothetical protein